MKETLCPKVYYLAKKRLPEEHELRNFQVKHIPFDALEVVEPQIYSECQKAASRNDSVPSGEMRWSRRKTRRTAKR